MTDSAPSHLALATIAVAAGRPPRVEGGPVNVPPVLTSTYVSTTAPGPGDLFYGRNDNETWRALESALAALEGAAQPAVAFASGMAAVAAALALVPRGGRVVMPQHSYGVVLGLAAELAAAGDIRLSLVDIADTAAVVAALSRAPAAPGAPGEPAGPGVPDEDPAALLWLETPTNPMLEVADTPVLAAAAHARGALVVADNTFATPLAARPLTQGADVVVHSVTKYLAGHSDVIFGAALTNDEAVRTRLCSHRTVHGAIPGPFEAWLVLRGLRTLALRVERSQANAAELARRLSTHPAVVEVRHPSLPTDPGHERAARLMTGFGSIIGLRPAGGAAGADAVVSRVRLWLPATSLGGVGSSLERRRRLAIESPTVPDDLLRLSVGIEDVEDLWRDLDQALRG
ncbi:MAG: PLP-dependent transferase [Micrococcales bacterium]|nr:PLP-dependent transferase [Micrococcales bacterium]